MAMDDKPTEQSFTDATQRSMLPCFSLCGAGGWVCWEEENDPIAGPWDHDAVECFTVFGLPFFPRRAFHTCNWSSESHLTHFGPHPVLQTDYAFQVYPIGLTSGLIARSFLRRWLYLLGGCGLVTAVLGPRLSDELSPFYLVGIGVVLVLFSLIGALVLKRSESRTRRIRRLLGRH
jgi:hypothetical protein